MTEAELSFFEAPANGFELWDVTDGQGLHLGQLAHMPERLNRDGSPYEGGDHWWAMAQWTEDGRPGDRCLTGFHPDRYTAVAALLGFFNGEGGVG